MSTAQARHLWRLVAVALPLLTLSCSDDPAGPRDDDAPHLPLNTMVGTVKGATIDVDGTSHALGGFLHVPTGEGTGIHLQAEFGGLPLVIHIPGEPSPGAVALGRWDTSVDYVRRDTLMNVGRGPNPSIFFGPRPAVTLGHYNGLEHGTLEIDAVDLPAHPDYFDKGVIRGRIHARAALDTLGSPAELILEPDTVDIVVEFNVELEGWAIGRTSAEFIGGALAGESATTLTGSGLIHYRGSEATDTLLVVSLTGPLTRSGERLQLWFGTTSREPGKVEFEFHVPVLFFIHWMDGPPPSESLSLRAVPLWTP